VPRETLGVLCDELSAPVLVLNLRGDIQSLTGKVLNVHAAAGEPYRISVRQMRLHPPVFDRRMVGPVVHVCENPTVVDVAANRLAAGSQPLVCIIGQPKTASRMLLDALVRSGIQIKYHGDFDWYRTRYVDVAWREQLGSSFDLCHSLKITNGFRCAQVTIIHPQKFQSTFQRGSNP